MDDLTTMEVIPLTGGWAVYWLAVAFVFGTVFGSFITCLADRLEHHESVLRGRSHCDTCGHVLGVPDLVPVLSWVFLRGRCRYCGAKIPPRDMYAELLLGGTFALCVWRFGLGLPALRWMACACCLLGLSLVDLDTFIIPDRFQAALLVIYGVTLPFTGCGDSAVFFADRFPPLAAQLLSGLIGGAVLGGGMLGLSLVFDRVTGKESLGGGDIKLLFLAGLYLGPWKGVLCLILACILGLLFARIIRQKRIPFGPSISAAMLLTALFGGPLVEWYVGLL